MGISRSQGYLLGILQRQNFQKNIEKDENKLDLQKDPNTTGNNDQVDTNRMSDVQKIVDNNVKSTFTAFG